MKHPPQNVSMTAGCRLFGQLDGLGEHHGRRRCGTALSATGLWLSQQMLFVKIGLTRVPLRGHACSGMLAGVVMGVQVPLRTNGLGQAAAAFIGSVLFASQQLI